MAATEGAGAPLACAIRPIEPCTLQPHRTILEDNPNQEELLEPQEPHQRRREAEERPERWLKEARDRQGGHQAAADQSIDPPHRP